MGFDLIGTKHVDPGLVLWWARQPVPGGYKLYHDFTLLGLTPDDWFLTFETDLPGFPYGVEVDPD